MRQRRFRLGIRVQLTLVVLLAAVLSTAATLFIANNAIQQYALQQARTQEEQSMSSALLVLQTQYGQNISISSAGQMVADSPTVSHDLSSYSSGNFGQYPLNSDTDYVDQVKDLIGGFVNVYQCANSSDKLVPCVRIATTFNAQVQNTALATIPRDTGELIEQGPLNSMNLASVSPQPFLGEVTLNGDQYYADYTPLLNPQQQVIGVLAVGVPLDNVTAFQQATTIQLLLLGVIVMIAGFIFALLFASSIVSTLQNVARQVSFASQRIGAIAAQQVGGAEQQVWAVGSINKALQNFAETTRDISHRTDQLAQMGDQVVRRRVDIMPQQIDTILAYITRSVRDISTASRQEAQQYERMTGAMQAVMEIAEQVSSGSQQATESARRLDDAVVDLQQIVGVRALRQATGAAAEFEDFPSEAVLAAQGALPSQPSMGQMNGYGSSGAMGLQQMGQMGPMSGHMMGGSGQAPMGPTGRGSSGQIGVRSDRAMRGGGNMGRMPDTAASMGGALPAGVMGGPRSGGLRANGGRMNGMNGMNAGRPGSGPIGPMGGAGQMGPMGGAGQMGPMGPMGPDAQLPPLGGSMDLGGFAGRMSFGGDARQEGDYGAPMPPLPDFPGGGPQGAMSGQVRDAAPPPGRTRGVRGPLSGPRNPGQNGGNGGGPGGSLPDWLTERDR